ncbi:MAG: TIGR00282 family metallophosphoesterase [Candidatus Aminicenantes bacterium]|nr:TIGR00282 family metallophosphoesterase [Candidatus Aminicenantes bacterium]
MKILFFGDVIGRPGRTVLRRYIPVLRKKFSPDIIIANAENSAGGVGITEKIGDELLSYVDVLTSGNHIWDKKEGIGYIDKEPRLLRPANYPDINPGRGSYIFDSGTGHKIGVINLQGRVFMEAIDCPFRSADQTIETLKKSTPVILVDFHAEATSEKQALGWYLDGKVSAVIGTHTHVPTADERILPKGTAYISDAGMVGGLNTVIGIRKSQAVQRFLTARPQRFEPSKEGVRLNAVYLEVNPENGKALFIQRENIIEEKSDFSG